MRIFVFGWVFFFIFLSFLACGNTKNVSSLDSKPDPSEFQTASPPETLPSGSGVAETAVSAQDGPVVEPAAETVSVQEAPAVDAGAAASDTAGDPLAPPWINREAPAAAFWGTGSARQAQEQFSIIMAEARAREDLARKVDSFVRLNKAAGEEFSVLLEKARPIEQWKSPDGTWWCLVELSGGDAEKALGSAKE